MTTPIRRRRRDITSNLDAFRAEPALHLGLNLPELLLGAGLKAHHEDGLGIRCADQSPAVAEKDADTVDSNHLVFGAEVFGRLFDDSELLVVRALNPNLRRGDEARDVGQQFANGFSGVRY